MFYSLNLLGVGGMVGVGLALSVAILQYFQVKLSLSFNKKAKENEKGLVLEKKKDSKEYSAFTPNPEVINSFMLYGMPIMVGFFTFSLSAGIGLYWGISTLFSIFQQLFVNKIVKK